jgi:flagellar hook protein FlgE
MITSFSTALSALSAQSTAIDVVGNNLANLNTPGFKESVVSFHDLVTQSLGAGLGETQIGFGVGRPITLRNFSQGALQTTTGKLDAAIQGDGFFVAQDNAGATLYTRGGNMMVDLNGNLTTSTGQKLQGWTILPNSSGVLDTNATIGDIVVPVGSLKSPTVTKNLSVDINLDAAASAAAGNDKFSTSIEIYDTLGTSHVVKINFTKSATANEWDYSLQIPDADITGGTFTPLTGKLTFNPDGTLKTPAATDPMPVLSITNLADSAADMDVTWNLYDVMTPRITQFAQKSATSALAQDGSPAANLVSVGLGDGGKILAQYSNGQQTVVGQLAMAMVRNPESLIAVGNNNFSLSARSALPAIGLPNTGGRGSVVGGAVEASTVDIAKEFTNLIVLQRGYQANAKVVTTADELSQETINLKR